MPDRAAVKAYLLDLQARICAALEQLEDEAPDATTTTVAPSDARRRESATTSWSSGSSGCTRRARSISRWARRR